MDCSGVSVVFQWKCVRRNVWVENHGSEPLTQLHGPNVSSEPGPDLRPDPGLTPSRGPHHVPGRESLAVIGRCWRGLYLFFCSLCFLRLFSLLQLLEDSDSEGPDRDHFTPENDFSERPHEGASGTVHISTEAFLIRQKPGEFFLEKQTMNVSFVSKSRHFHFISLRFLDLSQRLRHSLIYSVIYDLCIFNCFVLIIDSSVRFLFVPLRLLSVQ